MRIFTIDAQGVPELRHNCAHDPDGAEPAHTHMCEYGTYVDGQGDTVRVVDETLALPLKNRTIDEVLVLVSAGAQPSQFEWSIGSLQPRVIIHEPSSSRPADVGHATAPAGSPAGKRPVLVRFAVRDEENEPVWVDPDDIVISVPNCPAAACPKIDPCVLSGEPSQGSGSFELVRFVPGTYWALVTLPDCYYAEQRPEDWLDLRVEALGIAATEPEALHVTATAERVALQLVLDQSPSMREQQKMKLRAAQRAAQLLAQAQTDQDSIGIVAFSGDARTYFALQSRCADPAMVELAVQESLASYFDEAAPIGCTSLGDGLLEAQAHFAALFDDYLDTSSYWDALVECYPNRQAMVVISDGLSNNPYWPLEDYYDPDTSGYYAPVPPDTLPRDGQPEACTVNDPDDDFLPSAGWLRYWDRKREGLTTPIISAVAVGQNADGAELQTLLDTTENLGTLSYVEEPADDSFATEMRLSLELSDAFRQSVNRATGYERAGAWRAVSTQTHHMPLLEVEPLTSELLVSLASARDDTSHLRLLSPSGQLVEPVHSLPESSVFRVAAPEPGSWSFHQTVAGCPELPGCPPDDGPPAVFVEQAVRSIITLHAEADVALPWAKPPGAGDPTTPYALETGRLVGTPMVIRALPSDGRAIRSADVYAEVTTPGDATHALMLHDDGRHADGEADDGVYAAIVRHTNEAGTYRAWIVASGTSTVTGAGFRREASIAFHLNALPDTDGDGLPDWWEQRYDLNPAGPDELDPDGDGLTNADEYELGTSPVNADTDGGGESDGSEYARGGDLLDANDDRVYVWQPRTAPGNAKVLLDTTIPLMVAADIEIAQADEPEGPYELVHAGPAPPGGVVAIATENGSEACLRMRTQLGAWTSGWSAPLCSKPAVDPLPPYVRLSVASGAVRRGDETFVLRIEATDAVPATLGSAVQGFVPVGGWGAELGLLDPDIAPSGLDEMIVALDGDYEQSAWQAYEPELILPVPEADYATVHVKVRDRAGNESAEQRLMIWVAERWPQATLVGRQSVWLGPGSAVAGDITVVEQAGSPLAGAAALWGGPGAEVKGDVRASAVRLLPGATVTGDVLCDELSGHGSVGGSAVSPLFNPVHVSLPVLAAVTPGALDVTVSRRRSHTLEAGAYDTVRLQRGSQSNPTTLTLTGGLYELGALLLARHSRLECAAPCEIRVAGKVWSGGGSYLGPATGAQSTADVELLVAGHDGRSRPPRGFPKAVTFGASSELSAQVYAPDGTLWLKRGAEAVGTLAAAHIRLDAGAKVAREP